MLSSCFGTRKLLPNQLLYSGASIKIHSDTVIEGKRAIATKLKDNLYPEANSKVLGMPFKLMVYNMMGKAKPGNGLSGYLKYNYGEQPVLMADVPEKDVVSYLNDLLKANGYLDGQVTSEAYTPKLDKKKRKIIYHCYLQPPYFIRKLTNGVTDTAIFRIMQENSEKALIHANDRYDLDKLKQERIRIDNFLKQQGYFYFSPDFLLYKADSIKGKKEIHLVLVLKPGIDPKNLRPWIVNHVLIKNEVIADTLPPADTVTIKGVSLVLGKAFRPKAIRPFVLFGKGDLFTFEKYSYSNKNLSSVSAFKYTNMDISPDTVMPNLLNIVVTLRPYEQRNLRVEADVTSKSNSFAGPGLGISHTNRNIFGGGEQFTVKLNGSLEAYLTKDTIGMIGAYNDELVSSAELSLPRFWLLSSSRFSQKYIPHTHFKLEGRYVNQMRYYRMSFFRFIYGYQWVQNEFVSHELNPGDIIFQHLLKNTIYFDTLVLKNPLLKQSYADQFMVGSSYTYQYNVPTSITKTFKTAFTGSLDISGNVLYALNLLADKSRTGGVPLKLFGAVFSQFIKTTLDYRMIYNTSRNNMLVSRLFVGVGLPLGNSSVLPDVKQFITGGPNSIRAFKYHYLGPGAYDASGSDVYLNRTGDVRLEGNIENRFKIANRFEIALFLDAGNIWLIENDSLRPASQFKFNQFYRQLGIGWGYGLRYLNDLFVIRLDVGNQLHSPIPITKSPVFNFAIGYPF